MHRRSCNVPIVRAITFLLLSIPEGTALQVVEAAGNMDQVVANDVDMVMLPDHEDHKEHEDQLVLVLVVVVLVDGLVSGL